MRVSFSAALALAGICIAGAAHAHGPTRQKVVETITIDAPADAVWKRIKEFGDLGWHPAVEGTTATDGNKVGSVRTIALKGGGTIVETLESYSDADHKYGYRMKDPGPVPVNNYTSTISVSGSGATSTVEWRGAFYRAFLNNDPPPEQNDEAAIKAVTGIYKSGLDALKKSVEGK
ncbi:SRPBCC family protein [Derxia gummosa]|uniref:SRPBCC family protein n=1 Tax=Derxia gummosa DSM 723 TaxID=1121388 RepID=A0A8B6X6M2_9BURK|nr:SRPBCC family protein [Derxia gummosa]